MTGRFGALALAVFAGLVLLLAGALLSGRDPAAVQSVLVGKPVRDFVLDPLPGRDRDPAADGLTAFDLRKGEPAIVNFWASWCAPCRLEHPLLLTLRDRAGVPVHGINYKDDPKAALAFLQELGDPFERVGRDGTGRIAIDWGVYGVPETFVVDGQGRILARHTGALTREAIRTTIEPALARARAAAPPPAAQAR